jgi:hypothetical protein
MKHNPFGSMTMAGAIAISNAHDRTLTYLSMSMPSVKGKLRYDVTTGLVNLIGTGQYSQIMQIARTVLSSLLVKLSRGSICQENTSIF